ncbi:MAG: hypothetical protein IPP77_11855 [Bacteroidetes bacterium]|nr:hypothetical protein [Bacteroidota bacterium]
MANFFRISKKVGEDQAINLDSVAYISSYNQSNQVFYRLHIIKGEHEKLVDLNANTPGLREALGFKNEQ